MKIGFQTIIWWPFRDPLQYRLKVIEATGYQGVELKERPDQLPPVEELLALLEKHHLKLIGLAGGSLKRRMDYCQDPSRVEYLYVEDMDEEVAKEASDRGFTLAIHPHVFKPTYNLAKAMELLEKYPQLKFVPDVAHLTIAGDNPVNTIERFAGKADRIAGVHFKDWTPEFGRSAHRYARGFVELGAGDGTVNLDVLLDALRRIAYDGWLIVEQDSTKEDPAISAFKCATWLFDRKLLSQPPQKPPAKPLKRNTERASVKGETPFLETAVSAVWQGLESCYDSIAGAFLQLSECDLVTLWTCSPAHGLMNLVGVVPEQGWTLPIDSVLDYRNVLSGETIAEQTIKRFPLREGRPHDVFGCPELLHSTTFQKMISIPVFNPWNPNHVRLVANLFYVKDGPTLPDRTLEELAVSVGYSTSSVLDEVCLASASKVNRLVGKNTTLEDFVDGLTALIARLVNCEEVVILLAARGGNELELLGHVGNDWILEGVDQWYEARKNSIGQMWDTKQTMVMPQLNRGSEGTSTAAGERASCMATPFVKGDGTVMGLVYCCGKRAPREQKAFRSFAFSDDDSAILEAIAQAAVAHIEVLGERERRDKMLGRLTHELKVPLVAIRGAAEFILRTEGVDDFFDYDYPGDIWSWTDLMGRLIDNADAFRYSAKGIPIKATRTSLLRDVIAPAIRQARLLLRERGFSPANIYYAKDELQRFPALWLDRNQFQQVVFNLLSNAIKYANQDPNSFRVEVVVEGHRDQGPLFILGTPLEIRFRDWGPGIEEGMQEAIFEEGVRGADSMAKDVAGQGLGLWVVRQIVEAHGGKITVTSLYSPTEFTVRLPSSLKSQPPQVDVGE